MMAEIEPEKYEHYLRVEERKMAALLLWEEVSSENHDWYALSSRGYLLTSKSSAPILILYPESSSCLLTYLNTISATTYFIYLVMMIFELELKIEMR